MTEVAGKVGRVHRITERGLVRVQYPGTPAQDHRWAITPLALRLVAGHTPGDRVTVTADRSQVSRYQNPAPLESVLGCSGVVTLVPGRDSLVIDFGGGRVATMHPGCLEIRGGAGLQDPAQTQVRAELTRGTQCVSLLTLS